MRDRGKPDSLTTGSGGDRKSFFPDYSSFSARASIAVMSGDVAQAPLTTALSVITRGKPCPTAGKVSVNANISA